MKKKEAENHPKSVSGGSTLASGGLLERSCGQGGHQEALKIISGGLRRRKKIDLASAGGAKAKFWARFRPKKPTKPAGPASCAGPVSLIKAAIGPLV